MARCTIKKALFFSLLCCLALGAVPGFCAADSEGSAVREAGEGSQGISPLRMLQKFVSRADGSRCPMYPSCSHYSAQAIAEKGKIAGWVLTCDRLLRCGRDETRLAAPIRVQGVRHAFDPLPANTFWWDKR